MRYAPTIGGDQKLTRGAFRQLAEIKNTCTWAFCRPTEIKNTSTGDLRRGTEIKNTRTRDLRRDTEIKNTRTGDLRRGTEIKNTCTGDLRQLVGCGHPRLCTGGKAIPTAFLLLAPRFRCSRGAIAPRLLRGNPVEGRSYTRSRKFYILGHTRHWPIRTGKAANKRRNEPENLPQSTKHSPQTVSG